ncbi:SDR family NAD(P)-dependent oxidoreductase [Actinomycetota bacterium]
MDLNLKNKIAIVTGCRGICAEIAQILAEEGVNVVVTFISKKGKKASRNLVKKLESVGIEATNLNMDLLDLKSISHTVEEVLKKFKRIDILVNCAGDCIPAKAEDFTEEQWEHDIGVNLKGLYFCCKEVANKAMIKQKEGIIVNIASLVGVIPIKTDGVYDVAKSGVIMLSQQLALEWGEYNIRVNAVSPGWIITQNILDRVKKGKSAELEPALRIIPLNKFGKPEDIANLVAFLCSEKSKFITGENIIVDGGMSRGIRLAKMVRGKIKMIY